MTEKIVSSWNEWGRLQEIILGNADGSAVVDCKHPCEQARMYHCEERLSKFVGMRPKEKIDAASEELENFSSCLTV